VEREKKEKKGVWFCFVFVLGGGGGGGGGCSLLMAHSPGVTLHMKWPTSVNPKVSVSI